MTRNDIDSILAAHPGLGSWGFDHAKLTDAQRAQNLSDAQEEHFVDWCNAALTWLTPIAKIKTINLGLGSYGLKHIVEDQYGYISNGAFIVAAIHAGFKFDVYGPNAWFNMSKRSITAARRAWQEVKYAEV
jgi:hypothetical protein